MSSRKLLVVTVVVVRQLIILLLWKLLLLSRFLGFDRHTRMLLFGLLLHRFLLWFFVIFFLFAVEYVSGNKLDKFVVENVEDFVSDYVQFVLFVRQVVL